MLSDPVGARTCMMVEKKSEEMDWGGSTMLTNRIRMCGQPAVRILKAESILMGLGRCWEHQPQRPVPKVR